MQSSYLHFKAWNSIACVRDEWSQSFVNNTDAGIIRIKSFPRRGRSTFQHLIRSGSEEFDEQRNARTEIDKVCVGVACIFQILKISSFFFFLTSFIIFILFHSQFGDSILFYSHCGDERFRLI